jgi:hypothetical protein
VALKIVESYEGIMKFTPYIDLVNGLVIGLFLILLSLGKIRLSQRDIEERPRKILFWCGCGIIVIGIGVCLIDILVHKGR